MVTNYRGFYDRSRNVFRRWLAAGALACISLSANALNAERYPDIDWTLNGNKATASPVSRSPGPTSFRPSTGGPTFGGNKPLPWPGKSQAENMAKWKQMASPSNLSKSIIRSPVPLLLTTALALLMEEACVRIAGGSMQQAPGGQWEECNMTERAVTPTKKYYNTYRNPTVYDTVATACGFGSPTLASPEFWHCISSGQFVQSFYSVWTCPKISGSGVDIIGPVYNNGYTLAPNCAATTLVRDGWKPASATTAENAITSAVTAWGTADIAADPTILMPGKSGQFLEEALKAGAKPEVSPSTVTGPATVEANPKVEKVTSPDGATTTTTTTAITNKFTYNGDTITKTEVTNITTSVTNNTTNTTTTTTEATEKTDERTECEKDPTPVQCNMDSPEEQVPKSNKNVDYSIDDLGLGSGSCPSPVSATAGGRSYSLSYQPACDFATSILKPVLLAIAAIMAYFIAAGGIREQ